MERFRGCLLGLACGDAVGTTVEFMPRGSFPLVTDMVGGGPFNLQAGEWTDDTSMALCLATSLLECCGFDPEDQMNRYVDWYRNGFMAVNGTCFDIGNTVHSALNRYQQSQEPYSGSTDPFTAGNGSIMRLAPVVLMYHPDLEYIIYYCGESSRTTHGAQECIDACRLLGLILHRALNGAEKVEILADCDHNLFEAPKIKSIASGNYKEKSVDQIKGSGYVVKSLEAALWCFWMTDSFEEAILKAANLGDDADTTAAICGQVAGAYYKEGGIPASWLEKLVMADEIRQMADSFYKINES
jgi:ADP-ribosyl-[dinitrogen reductase] hydrolase